MRMQEQLFTSRRASLRADLQVIEEGIRGQEEQLRAYENMAASRRTQLQTLNEDLKNAQQLIKEGFISRSRSLELERAISEANTQIQEQVGNIARARQSISELRVRAVARQQEYRKEIETQMADISRGVQAGSEKFNAAQGDLERMVIRAPATGQVVGLQVQTVGGVVQAGQKLADIVPAGEGLLLEARVKPQMIDRVQAGMLADIRFQAFANTPQLVVEGRLLSVSGDLIVDSKRNNEAHYLARLQLTDKGLHALGERRLDVDIAARIHLQRDRTQRRCFALGLALHPVEAIADLACAQRLRTRLPGGVAAVDRDLAEPRYRVLRTGAGQRPQRRAAGFGERLLRDRRIVAE
jgi:protease secretion system membrane fusion protein